MNKNMIKLPFAFTLGQIWPNPPSFREENIQVVCCEGILFHLKSSIFILHFFVEVEVSIALPIFDWYIVLILDSITNTDSD